MKRRVFMTTIITTAVLMAGATFADEITHSTAESNRVTVTPTDPIYPPSVQEKRSMQTEHRSSTVTADPLEPSVQERSRVRTEHRSSTVTSDPLSRPSVQERSSDSYRKEERSSASDPLDTEAQITKRSRVEERSSTVAPAPEVQQRLTIEHQSSTTTSK